MGDNELFDFFQDMYLVAETLVGNTPVVPTPADYYTNPAKGWLVTTHAARNALPDRSLTATGTRLQAGHRESFRGRPARLTTRGFVGPNGGDFAFNFGSAVAGPGA